MPLPLCPLVSALVQVGAGRGPLVRASLRAAHSAKRTIRVYAVEKNPNAVITLRNMVKTERWEGIVTVVSSDMRVWDAPEKVWASAAMPVAAVAIDNASCPG